MKKVFAAILVMMVILSALSFAGCSEKALPTTHSAHTRIGFRTNGETGPFDMDIITFDVGKEFAMKLEMVAISSDSLSYPVTVTLTIPNVKHVDAKRIYGAGEVEGEKKTPDSDIQSNETVYTFKINTNEQLTDMWKYLFLLSPNSEGEVTLSLKYGDPIPEHHSQTRVLIFRNATQETEQE